ncbi:serine/threonine-protein kinase [Archangium lansingense]|uniref:Serine/threonine-protein kinase n=1 Tax=Archangium lansingense TaxID=2995310 RepID=A0ABT4ALW3_9BACT|nr:serine/threonine-protein kinase [Archangium lansinium]MCY1082677.1 serine/threonine-protein kinase [Archangium lansinium]
MEEVPGGSRAGGERARRWWLSKLLWKPEMQGALLPPVGSTVGGYHLEAKLGRGGQGTVYRARRGGKLYAVKFLYLPVAGSRARAEVEVLPRLERVGVVKLEGHGKWPDASPLFLFIAMEFVRGRPLYDWARENNPTVRQVAQVLLELARQLAAVHAQQVLHRDVKGANVLVGLESGQPVLVDFGASTWRGAPRRTVGLPPGSWFYRGPEVWRFVRERRPGTHYEASVLDDLWALGVTLYRLLTDAYPFDAADELAFQDAVLTQSPEPPHVRNPRVPRALSELCLRMLEKEPGARLPTAEALEAAVNQALQTADAEWDVPLYRQCMAPPPGESATLQPPTREAPQEEEEAGQAEPQEVPPRRATPAWTVWALLGLALLLAVWALLAITRAPPPLAPAASAELPLSTGIHSPEGWAGPGQEVAPVSGGPEGAGGAAPRAAAIPAPVARATPAKDTRMKTPHKDSTTQQAKYQEKHEPLPSGAAGTCVMLWAVGQLACTGPAAQVRPLTPADCPPEAQKAMKEWRLSDAEAAWFPVEGDAGNTPVRRGYGASLTMIEDWGRMPGGSVLTGELVFGEERVYGRFTEARTPEGKWFPVCVQILDTWDRKLGVKLESRSGPDTAVVYSNVLVEAVRE